MRCDYRCLLSRLATVPKGPQGQFVGETNPCFWKWIRPPKCIHTHTPLPPLSLCLFLHRYPQRKKKVSKILSKILLTIECANKSNFRLHFTESMNPKWQWKDRSSLSYQCRRKANEQSCDRWGIVNFQKGYYYGTRFLNWIILLRGGIIIVIEKLPILQWRKIIFVDCVRVYSFIVEYKL